MPHVIRLTDHWTITETETSRRFVRRFGAPRTLTTSETVWLVGTAASTGTIVVNGELAATLATGTPFTVDLTARLKPRNVAVIEMDGPVELGEITLEIRT